MLKRGLKGNFFFAQLMVDTWNLLPEEVVESHTITMFKRHLDRQLRDLVIEGYSPNVGWGQ